MMGRVARGNARNGKERARNKNEREPMHGLELTQQHTQHHTDLTKIAEAQTLMMNTTTAAKEGGAQPHAHGL